MKLLYIFFIIVNVIGFISIRHDKRKAKKRGMRIPEFNFFLMAALGGAAGIFLGMKLFRHKTKHKSFTIGIPLLFGLNFLTVYLVVTKF